MDSLQRIFQIHFLLVFFQANTTNSVYIYIFLENLFSTKIKYFQSDSAKEYDNTPFLEYLVAHGIYFWKSGPHTQQQWCCWKHVL